MFLEPALECVEHSGEQGGVGQKEQRYQYSGAEEDGFQRFHGAGQGTLQDEIQALCHDTAGNSGVEIQQRQKKHGPFFQAKPFGGCQQHSRQDQPEGALRERRLIADQLKKNVDGKEQKQFLLPVFLREKRPEKDSEQSGVQQLRGNGKHLIESPESCFAHSPAPFFRNRRWAFINS